MYIYSRMMLGVFRFSEMLLPGFNSTKFPVQPGQNRPSSHQNLPGWAPPSAWILLGLDRRLRLVRTIGTCLLCQSEAVPTRPFVSQRAMSCNLDKAISSATQPLHVKLRLKGGWIRYVLLKTPPTLWNALQISKATSLSGLARDTTSSGKKHNTRPSISGPSTELEPRPRAGRATR